MHAAERFDFRLRVATPPELAPSCAEGGVIGVLPGIIGVIQATETIKVMLGIGEPLIETPEGDSLVLWDTPGFGDTLQALQRHETVDPLARPGEADLTVHAIFEQ